MCVSNPFFPHIKSWYRKTLHIQGFGGHIWPNMFCTYNHIEMLLLRYKRCTNFVTYQVTLGSTVPQFAMYSFQGHFCKITLSLFHLSLKIRKSHGNSFLNIFLSIQIQSKRSPKVVDHSGFLSRA